MLTLYLTLLDDEEDKNLFENLYYSYRKQMITVAQSVLQDSSDAEDAVHEVFLRIAVKYMDMIRSTNLKRTVHTSSIRMSQRGTR